MSRQATQAFNKSRDARFAESRKESKRLREQRQAEGLERTMLLVNLDEVEQGDEVLTQSGFELDAEQDSWVVNNGQTAVRRFVVS